MLCIIKTGFTQGETMNLLEKKIAEILEDLKEKIVAYLRNVWYNCKEFLL